MDKALRENILILAFLFKLVAGRLVAAFTSREKGKGGGEKSTLRFEYYDR